MPKCKKGNGLLYLTRHIKEVAFISGDENNKTECVKNIFLFFYFKGTKKCLCFPLLCVNVVIAKKWDTIMHILTFLQEARKIVFVTGPVAQLSFYSKRILIL